jgi:hypothetical protein
MPAGARDSCHIHNVRTGSGAHQFSCSVGTGVTSWAQRGWEGKFTTDLELVRSLRMNGALTLRPLCASMSWTGKNYFSFTSHIHLVSARKYILASLQYRIVFPNRGFAVLCWTVTAMIFRCVRMAAYVLISFFMFVRLPISARPPLDGIPRNLIWGHFYEDLSKKSKFC